MWRKLSLSERGSLHIWIKLLINEWELKLFHPIKLFIYIIIASTATMEVLAKRENSTSESILSDSKEFKSK